MAISNVQIQFVLLLKLFVAHFTIPFERFLVPFRMSVAFSQFRKFLSTYIARIWILFTMAKSHMFCQPGVPRKEFAANRAVITRALQCLFNYFLRITVRLRMILEM
jgi:hypothetical protein